MARFYGPPRGQIAWACIGWGVAIGMSCGATLGTFLAGPVGFVLGALIGLVLSVPPTSAGAALIAAGDPSGGDPARYRQRVDRTLGLLGAGVTAAGAWLARPGVLDLLRGRIGLGTTVLLALVLLTWTRRQLLALGAPDEPVRHPWVVIASGAVLPAIVAATVAW